MANFFENYKKKRAEEKEEWNRRNPENLPTKMQTICKMIVGVYLLYLVYKMLSDGALTENKGWSLVLMIAAMVLFVAAGIYFGLKGLKAYRRGEFFDPNKDDFSEEAKAEAAEAEALEAGANEDVETEKTKSGGEVKPGSMAAFARLSAAAAVSEEEQDAAYEEAKEANEQMEASESYTE